MIHILWTSWSVLVATQIRELELYAGENDEVAANYNHWFIHVMFFNICAVMQLVIKVFREWLRFKLEHWTDIALSHFTIEPIL